MTNDRKRNRSVSVTGIIYVMTDNEKMLLARRVKKGSNFFGEYLFPAGRIEVFDTSTQEALKREVFEERGCIVKNAQSIGVLTYSHPTEGNIKMEVFVVDKKDIDGEVVNMEPDKEELYWVTKNEALKRCTYAGAKMVLKLLERNLII